MNKKKVKFMLLILFFTMMIATIYLFVSLQASFSKGRTVDLEESSLSSVAIDPKGRPWILERNGNGDPVMKVFEGSSWITYSPSDAGFPSDIQSSQVFDLAGNLWIPTNKSGLVKYDGKNWETLTAKNSGLVADDKVGGLAVNNRGRIWIHFYHLPCCGSNNSPGVTVFDGSTWKTYNTDNSGLPSNEVYSVAFDANNRAWFGTNKGLSIFDGEQWITYTPQNSGIDSTTIWSIAFDRDQNLAWIGISGDNNLIGSSGDNNGVNTFDGKNWKYYTSEEMGFSGDRISSNIYNVFVDQSERVWVWDENLRIYDHDTWIGIDETIIPPNITSITTDEQGNIWISTFDGLIKLDKDYRFPSEKHYQLLRIYRIALCILAGLILVTLTDIKKDYRIILLVIASIVLLPLLAIGGFAAGVALGMAYTDFPIIEVWMGGVLGGAIGIGIIIFLWKKFSPRK